MKSKTALFLSVLFHPVFVNAFTLWLLFNLFPTLHYGVHPVVQWYYMGFVFISTGIIPLIWVVITGFILKKTSLMLEEKEDRNLPYILTSSFYLFDFYLSKKIGAPVLVSSYLLACSSILVAVLIINIFTKISIHAASMGALVALITLSVDAASFDIRTLVATAIFLSGMVMSARLFLEAHQPAQIYSGFLCGFVLMWVVM